MPPSGALLVQLLNCANQTPKPMNSLGGDTDDALGLLKEVKVALIPKEHRITLPLETTGNNFAELPWDVLDVVSEKLDFDDLFQFSHVCANWRDYHKSNLWSSQEPLLLEISRRPPMVPCSFTSLIKRKVYPLKKMMMNMMSFSQSPFPIYVTYSSGYFVIVADDSSFLLINPFTRIKKMVIYPSTFKFSYSLSSYHALLAFDKYSEEFVLVFLFKNPHSLHVYQSRNNSWVTYSTNGNRVVDFVALNNIIYVVTKKAKIGVLSLSSANIEFLKLMNTPSHTHALSHFNFVNCDEQLLVVDFTPKLNKKVYKIDLSTMSYVELKTLGDIALFYVWWKSCKALRNPNRWGYESNSLYEVSFLQPDCTVYNWDKKSEKYIESPSPKTRFSIYDLCFGHLKYEVDYSLVE